eukprot:g2283.t1
MIQEAAAVGVRHFARGGIVGGAGMGLISVVWAGLKRRPPSLRDFFDTGNVRFGIFIGLWSGGYRAILSLLRRRRKDDADAKSASRDRILAGVLAGFSLRVLAPHNQHRYLYQAADGPLYGLAKDWAQGLLRAASMYVPVHTVVPLITRFKDVIQDPAQSSIRMAYAILGSSMFLSTYQTIVKGSQVILRDGFAHKGDQPWKTLISGLLTGFACCFESSARTNELMLYCAPKGADAAWSWLVKKGFAKSIPHQYFELLLFMCASGYVLSRDPEKMKSSYRTLRTLVFGDDSIPPDAPNVLEPGEEHDCPTYNVMGAAMEQLDREVLLEEVQTSLDDYSNCDNLTDEMAKMQCMRKLDGNFDRLYSDMRVAFVDSHDGMIRDQMRLLKRAFEAIPTKLKSKRSTRPLELNSTARRERQSIDPVERAKLRLDNSGSRKVQRSLFSHLKDSLSSCDALQEEEKRRLLNEISIKEDEYKDILRSIRSSDVTSREPLTDLILTVQEKTANAMELCETENIAKMTESGADEADVQKQREVLEETKAMIPECMNRLNDLVADLEAQVAEIIDAGGDDASGTIFTEAQAFAISSSGKM